MNKARYWVEAHGLPTPYLTWENTNVIARKVGEYIDFDRASRTVIARRGFLKFQVDILLNQRLVVGFHLNISRDRKNGYNLSTTNSQLFDSRVEYAYPPIGKAVPLYGASIKVGVPIRNCFDPAILRLKVDENLRRAEDSSPVEAREKGKSGAKKACLDVQRKLARSGNLSQQRQRPSPRSRRHPMTSIDNRRRDEGIVASLMADIGPTRDQMVDIPHEEIYKSRVPHQHPKPAFVTWPTDKNLEEVVDQVMDPAQSKLRLAQVVVSHDSIDFSTSSTSFSGAKKRRASVTVVHVITLGEDVKTLGEKTPSTLVAMLPPVEINTFSQAAVAMMGLATSEEIILRDEGETRADLVKEQSRELKANWKKGAFGDCDILIKEAKERLGWIQTQPVESFWSINGRGSDSAFWKGILNARDLLRKGSMTMVGKGDSVDVWTQPWIPWLDYGEFIELMNQVKPRYPHINSVADNSNPNGSWNIELLKEMFGDVLGERIGTINRIPQDNSNLVVWKEASDGRFTVKRGYNATLGGVSLEDGNLWKKVWGKKVHYRHSVMIWRAVMGCVPTRDRLDFVGDKSCPLCDGSSESALYIFWECHCARALWFSSPFPLCYGAGFGCFFEGIWKARNDFLFKGGLVDISVESNAGLAVGLLDRRNHESFWYAKYDQASSAAETELLAIKWALHLAEQKGFYSFAGASDAKLFIILLLRKK
ncbi:hypothetical protein G4B88_005187 [Cannabis sativa]|uniref:Reverse transcriptase zinc-binding domain-containing protein n=1 Tax=Cannabis sativa TaxID=3483 RepID=A0A7J6EPC9_CANSA|nr:hypothetical protein G4B88_005187 [Cannabis sativa]